MVDWRAAVAGQCLVVGGGYEYAAWSLHRRATGDVGLAAVGLAAWELVARDSRAREQAREALGLRALAARGRLRVEARRPAL